MSRRCRRHKERRRCSVQILDNFWDKCFEYKVAKKVCKQAPLLYAPTVPPLLPLLCFDIPPYSPCLPCDITSNSKHKWQILSLLIPEDPEMIAAHKENYAEEHKNKVPTTLYQKVKTMSVLCLLGAIFQVKGSSYSFMFYKTMQDS